MQTVCLVKFKEIHILGFINSLKFYKDKDRNFIARLEQIFKYSKLLQK